ncbi:MAG: hypothetical protein R3220_07765, partial [Balneolaceae bacterium]|nr:hypothetical protein [Balneolaceae bacterium]
MKYILTFTFCVVFLFMDGIRLSISGENNSADTGSSLNNCLQPITWRIGSIDSRYNIEEETLKRIMTEVSKLWSEAIGTKII